METYSTIYPKKERDVYEKIGNCVSEYGADDVHTVVPQGPTDSTSAANPSSTPVDVDGHGK